MAATIKDIRSETGLGLATISKYLNGGNVRSENRQKIFVLPISSAKNGREFTAMS